MAARTRNNATTESAERDLVITRIFDAPRGLVFKAWADPEHLAHWWGPTDFTLPSCTINFRTGGAYRFHMRSPEGADHWLRGVYREIVEPERLVFTYAWEDADGRLGNETVVTVTFAEHGGKTRLTLHQADFGSVELRDGHRAGWTSCLERFADSLATVAAA